MRLRRALSVVLTAALLGAVAVFVAQAFPGLVGADYALIVQSGSMEPAIPVGSVVFVDAVAAEQADTRITEGEVITYTDDGRNLVTHRVVEKHQAADSVRFVTKGDANENVDPEPVYRNEVVGELEFTVPFIGYVIAFGNTPMGFLTLVWGPVLALVFSELVSLYRAGMTPEEGDPEETTGT
jgi:signal peptidase